MYHDTTPHVIEGSDITHLHEVSIEKHPSGRMFAHMVVELNPAKNYNIPDVPRNPHTQQPLRTPVEHMLHITDGVHHRLLPQEHDYPTHVAVPLHGQSVALTLDEARDALPEPTVKGRKVRK